ncbi:MAG: error-prone DNA polymerase [Candidatus Andeanibacterium colombiense]|uniref:Error-prone DNA polymerase n=1 Tax=Candidatus Andeanibacterium colombiense TaxID=3121345 RepID=A0AAJ6BNJ4_9SPHN|nr:MAG: error-prone DNA polymerase [Sphingomonadaceae bacterium]
MPDIPLTPSRPRIDVDTEALEQPARAPFVELGLVSCFSFLRGASEATELVSTARAMGYDAIGIADGNTMAGVVRIHSAARQVKLRPVIGCRIETVEGLAFLAYPVDRAAYGRLCRLISAGRMGKLDGAWQDKGVCDISLAMLAEHGEGVQLILLPPEDLAAEFTIAVPGNVIPFPVSGSRASAPPRELTAPFSDLIAPLTEQLPGLGNLAASYLHRGDDIARIEQLDMLAQTNGLVLLATNDVHYHTPRRRALQDVMTAIRHKTTVAAAGHLLHANAERYLKSPAEMQALFARWPHAIKATREVADSCSFSLEELKYLYPETVYPEGRTPQQHLEALTWKGAEGRYPSSIPKDVRKALARELELIGELDLSRYFLTIKEIVDFARSQKPPILCQGRGSAANSAVCYCLEITSVNPATQKLLFDRFLSKERKEPPDIDVDFEHARREEVIQHIYERYGRDHAGLCATVIHYRPRMAVREVGKAMGLSEDVTSLMARTVWGNHGDAVNQEHVAQETGLDLSDPELRRVIALTDEMIGMPRHLSQHVGGFILTNDKLTETVPIGNGAMPARSFIEWDKDDIDELGIFKVDVLALGMLTCISKALDLLRAHHREDFTLATIPPEDPEVYDMLCKADSIGVFQVESRAQMSMLPRLQPREFYDLVVEVAIVRPGPIQGNMVHPYLKHRKLAREGKAGFDLPSPSPDKGPADELSSILGRTFGVPIFQEQAMEIAMVAAEFSPDEANQLRKAMATFRSRGMMHAHEEKMVGRMIERGYDPAFAERCFNQIKGFGEYGFPESHASSFALLVYASSWLKCHYPAAFAAALLNSQPMGFYAPAQIVRDAQEHGVTALPVDVNCSEWDNTLEEVDGEIALRLGLRQVDGFPEYTAAALVNARAEGGSFLDLAELRERAKLIASHIEKLAAADCFGSLALPRRKALWNSRSLVSAPPLPLFDYAKAREEGPERNLTHLPGMPLSEEVIADYQTQRLSLKAHPLSFLRGDLQRRGFTPCAELRSRKQRANVQVAGVVLIRQRPGSAKGVCFVTLEDESAIANLVVWPDVFARFRGVVMGARLIEARGRVEYEEGVLHVIVDHLADATASLTALSGDLPEADAYDSALHRHPRDIRIIPNSRDFH